MARPLFQLAITLAISLTGIRGSAGWQTNRSTASGLTQEKWVAASTTAMSITGDIRISSGKLAMVGRHYPLTLVRNIDAEHLIDAGKIVDETKPTGARLYRTKIPARAKLVNGNTICGPKGANWLLAVTQNAHSLSLAFFSGDGEPNLATASESTELCGTFGYFR
jgi:hypothetical protein